MIIDDFEDLVRAEHVRLVAVALAITGDRETARDVVQEAWASAFVSWSKVGRYDAPGAWVRRVMVNRAIDARRRRRSEVGMLERLKGTWPAPGPDGDPVDSTWWTAVRALPERQCIAVALHYVDGFRVDEIAAVMGIRPGTVKATLSHARRTLATALQLSEDRP